VTVPASSAVTKVKLAPVGHAPLSSNVQIVVDICSAGAPANRSHVRAMWSTGGLRGPEAVRPGPSRGQRQVQKIDCREKE